MNRFCFNKVWRPQWKAPGQTFLNPPPPPQLPKFWEPLLFTEQVVLPLTHLWLGTHEHAPDFFKFLSFPCSFFLQIGILLFYVNPLLLQERETSNSCPIITQCIWLIMTLCSSLLLQFFLLITTYKPFPNVSVSEVYQVERINCIYL